MENLLYSMGQVMDDRHILTPLNDEIINDISSGSLVYCIEEKSTTVIVKSTKGFEIELPKKDYKFRGFSSFHQGDKVITKDKQKNGEVYCVAFHFNRQEFYYLLKINNKISSHWYFDNDIERAD